MIVTFQEFCNILNKQIFSKSKAVLLQKIAKYPNRYLGLFRPTRPKAKILQNLLQSHEIRFGDAFETLIELYLKKLGYQIIDKNFTNLDGDKLNVDQCFMKNNKVYFIEQKIRDDHDSTKKRGQIQNFEKKLNVLIDKYGEKRLTGFFYFIDPELKKNKNYYTIEIQKMEKDYDVTLYLCYGKEMFDVLGYPYVWDEIINHLKKWKQTIPEIPETNFDIDAQSSFDEIKDLSPTLFRTVLGNNDIYNQIISTIFPEKRTLKLLLTYFKNKAKEKTIYKNLANLLASKL